MRFASSGETRVSTISPERKGHIACEYSALLAPPFSLLSTFRYFINSQFFYLFFFLADLEHGSFMHVVGNIYVAADLVVSLHFS